MEENVFKKEQIFLNVDAKTKEDVLKFIALQAKRLNIANDSDGVYSGLVEREYQFSTNLGEFISIPHTKNDTILSPAALF